MIKSGSLVFEGLHVRDFWRATAGLSCTRTLADFGADVIKTDNPMWRRRRAARCQSELQGRKTFYLVFNHVKRSISLDLTKG